MSWMIMELERPDAQEQLAVTYSVIEIHQPDQNDMIKKKLDQ